MDQKVMSNFLMFLHNELLLGSKIRKQLDYELWYFEAIWKENMLIALHRNDGSVNISYNLNNQDK